MNKAKFIIGLLCASSVIVGCDESQQPRSSSGVTKATAAVETNPNTGLTIEQENVKNRLEADNKPGSIKHLYIISPFTGDILIYSAVKGKVTSSGKRLTPKTIHSAYYNSDYADMVVTIGDNKFITKEVLQDDGTYGDSIQYIYWFDTKGIYHQQGVDGILWHISDQPLSVGKAKIVIDQGK